ncbi:uncharacterized protein EI90DRAFT_3124834 [Cantharellus anzutake]|uniref:uncharacterized protein n=1 Tax=Cantharellus anzutake TaxID=1750568 RepID=UPI0019041B81|nr:uncharacterized protein EI90DRAFT_3124834 [Cantharellus anzutake]KAF8330032.1 hypothetical protein EI90DRAFT_3124834 [Cantharellus anzutake]
MSASLHHNSRAQIQACLGFYGDQFHDEKLPVDQLDLKYCACVHYHSIDSLEFPDFAWAIPKELHSPSDLVPTLFAIRTVEKATVCSDWLIRELEQVAPDGYPARDLVWPFHAELYKEDHSATHAGLMSEMTQWAGRASRDGSGGNFIVYAPKEMIFTHEMVEDSKEAKKGEVAACKHYQSKAAPGLVKFFNPPGTQCQRSVYAYYGDDFVKPHNCCESCQEDTRVRDEGIVEQHLKKVAHRKALGKTKLPSAPRGVKNFTELTKDLKSQVLDQLTKWHQDAWYAHMDLQQMNLPPGRIIGDGDLRKLSNHLHILTSQIKFMNFLQTLPTELNVEMEAAAEKVKRKKGKESRPRQAARVQADVELGDRGEGSSGVPVGIPSENMETLLSRNQVLSAAEVMTGPRKWKLTERVQLMLEEGNLD